MQTFYHFLKINGFHIFIPESELKRNIVENNFKIKLVKVAFGMKCTNRELLM